MLNTNPILSVDSYKLSHWKAYPPGSTGQYSYIESRGGMFGQTLFFGLQRALKDMIALPVTAEHVHEAGWFAGKHGVPFNESGWMRVVEKHGGQMPVRICAVPEGSVIPTHNVLCTVESTDPELFWLPSYLETQLLRAIWYPTTVATLSWHCKKVILGYLQETANDPLGVLPFKLHDFGARGVSSGESAAIGGMAHLVNFKGSDTIEGVRYADYYYGSSEGISAYSIPAAEHSTVTSWGRDGEVASYRNMLTQFAKPGAIVAVVSDSYNLWNAIESIWCEALIDEVKASGATVVIRPDSGNPPDVVLKTLQLLERKVGMSKNLRGYKVLPNYFRVIQGDGIDYDTLGEILHTITSHGYSASNVGYGSGGGLLQKLDRDTMRFAQKCSEMVVDGVAIPVSKAPATDPSKASKAGRLALVMQNGELQTVTGPRSDDILKPVYENGKLLVDWTLDDVRAKANAALGIG